jgi:hypothetical protein
VGVGAVSRDGHRWLGPAAGGLGPLARQRW